MKSGKPASGTFGGRRVVGSGAREGQDPAPGASVIDQMHEAQPEKDSVRSRGQARMECNDSYPAQCGSPAEPQARVRALRILFEDGGSEPLRGHSGALSLRRVPEGLGLEAAEGCGIASGREPLGPIWGGGSIERICTFLQFYTLLRPFDFGAFSPTSASAAAASGGWCLTAVPGTGNWSFGSTGQQILVHSSSALPNSTSLHLSISP
ncbi:hypothetical protein N7462_004569 [Penicillium macrosclerotiorum]|uniref:uncharacterized protein n=1 Tax=Penicillium macrosclerotiorum TaxID=303699 RepID=UPI0025495094|nr:uncharacterized protein N7462_004569 [Penicillium macrosclerotiorum]KAJ5690177.1 hypothetical protein N7462_004569 [Penicillium macrosclerotiorum]